MDQFGEEANQEEENQTEHKKDSSLVEDEPHIAEETEEQVTSTVPMHSWKK